MKYYRSAVVLILCLMLAVVVFMLLKTIYLSLKEKYGTKYYYEEVQTFGIDNDGHYILQDGAGNLWLFDGTGMGIEPGIYVIKIDLEADDGDGAIVGVYKKISGMKQD